jgi:hypothetical protein
MLKNLVMTRSIQKLVIFGVIVLSALIVMPQLQASALEADTSKQAVCNGIGAISGSAGCEDNPDEANVDDTISTVINILSLITAVIAVIMIIVGGIRYVTSSGDSTSTGNAKNTVIYAVVGLVIVALAQLIVRFVVQRLAAT